MSCRGFAIVSLICFGGFAFLGFGKEAGSGRTPQEEERNALTHPQYAVPLLYGTQKAPVLATVHGDYLYFSQSKQNGACVGKGLYRMALMPDKRTDPAEELVLDPQSHDCIIRIVSDGKNLFFFVQENRDKQPFWVLKVLSGNKLESIATKFPHWHSEEEWLRHLEETKSGNLWETQQNGALMIGVQSEGKFRRLIRSDKVSAKIGLFASGGLPGTKDRGFFVRAPMFEDANRLYWPGGLAWDKVENGYALLLPKEVGGFSQLLVINLKTLQVRGVFGGESFDRENTLDKEGRNAFALRNAVALLPAAYGVVIEDHSDYQQEGNSLWYFPNSGSQVHRVVIPPEALENVAGISLYQLGFVVSQPTENRVIWYGPKSPFPPKIFPVRDIRLNELTESELPKQSGAKR